MAVLNNDGIRAGAAAAAAGGSGYEIKHSIQFDDETSGSWNGTNSGLYRHNADEVIEKLGQYPFGIRVH